MKTILQWIMVIAIIPHISSCEKKHKQKATDTFQTIHPIQTDTSFVTEYVGEIYAVSNVEIRSKLTEYIDKVLIDEGERVKKGQLLFKLSEAAARQELKSTEAVSKTIAAALKTASLELENINSLYHRSIVSKTELELAKVKVEGLEAQLEEYRAAEELAALRLSFTNIRAPFDGIVNKIPFKAGSLVEEGTPLTSVSHDNEVFVYFNMSEPDYLDYVTSSPSKEIQNVSLRLANGQMYDHHGIIETIDGEIDQSTGNIAFRARFGNENRILRHGGTGKVLVKNRLDQALIIPQKSTFEIQGNLYVYKVDKGLQIHATQIIPTQRLAHSYVISSGLNTSDLLVYEGIQRLKDGDHILMAESNITSMR